MKLKHAFPAIAAWLTLTLTPIHSARAETSPLTALFTNANRPVVTAVPRRPCIIFIQCHDLAAGDLSCYGQTNFQTPNLDRLATMGVRFTKYSGGGESAGTTARLLAGKSSATAPGEANLARLLKQNGYRTGLIGEWPFDRTPWLDGFDEFAGFFNDDEARDYYAEQIWRYPHTILDESNRVQSVILDHESLYQNLGGQKGQYLPDVMLTAAATFVHLHEPDAANRWRPFFLLVNLPAPRSASADKEVFPVPSDAPFTGERWPQAAKDRAALLTRMDGSLARLFEQLKKSGLTNNNVAVLFSSSSAPEKFADTNLNFLLPKSDFRGTNEAAPPRLPLLLHYAGRLPGGQTNDVALTAADLAPTLAEIAHVKSPTNFTGRSVLKHLTGSAKSAPK